MYNYSTTTSDLTRITSYFLELFVYFLELATFHFILKTPISLELNK